MKLISIVFIFILSAVSFYGLAEPPQAGAMTPEEDIFSVNDAVPGLPAETINPIDDEAILFEEDAGEGFANYNDEMDSESPSSIEENKLYELEQNYAKALRREQLDNAYLILKEIPQQDYSEEQQYHRQLFDLFAVIDKELEEESADFFKEDDLEEDIRKTIKRLFKVSQVSLLNDDFDTAKDLLIHILYLHRRNLKAKKLLNYGLNLKTGSYKVENIDKKYRKKSSVSFYGGNYEKALQYLKILSKINKEDPDIYHQIGSNYYMIGENTKAIEAWNTALFLDPKNDDLKEIVKRTQAIIDQSIKEERAQLAKKKQNKKSKKKDVNATLMGVFSDQTKAYNFARQYQQRGLKPIVEEQDDGKWSVSLPK